jgi:hypothetical protein
VNGVSHDCDCLDPKRLTRHLNWTAWSGRPHQSSQRYADHTELTSHPSSTSIRTVPNVHSACRAGNKRFRDIVALHRPDYVNAPKIQKPSVARVIVRAIRNGDPPGRFLRKDEKSGLWIDVGTSLDCSPSKATLRLCILTFLLLVSRRQEGSREDFAGAAGEGDGRARCSSW